MPNLNHAAGLFPALLKHWRGQRGLSQLDLSLAADVSSRHVSFLETGRSVPSAEMVLRLAAALDVPLRHVNALLQSAGHEPVYRESGPGEGLPEEVAGALQMMKDHHEPFPLVIIDRTYDVVDLNAGAQALFAALVGGAAPDVAAPLNLARLTFAPQLRDVLVNFDEVGRALLWRLQREVLADPNDAPLRQLLEELLELPTVADDWREADLTAPSSPAVTVHLRAGGHELRFLTAVTAFQAPQIVTLDELRIETWFPCDPATEAACRALAAELVAPRRGSA
ncbi:MAG: helix-turn-helix transcriptional regulator [Myxococcales bacterium]|nr:helix-turn-helix transcriptional regulator [Myxococcales bacterium]